MREEAASTTPRFFRVFSPAHVPPPLEIGAGEGTGPFLQGEAQRVNLENRGRNAYMLYPEKRAAGVCGL